jgi:hypothetical protein
MSRRDRKEMPFFFVPIVYLSIFVFGAGLVGASEGAAVAWLFVIGPILLWAWLMSRWPGDRKR